MTWFDGDPAHLWLYPPAEEGKRYVECIGGIEKVCDKAQQFIDRQDYRFAATLLAHAVAAGSKHESSRHKVLLASTFEQLGFGAENAIWRNFYLTGAQNLRTGKSSGMVAGGRTALGTQLSVDQWFELLSIQLHGVKAAEANIVIDFDIIDIKEKWRLILSNGALTRRLLWSPAKPNLAGSLHDQPQLSLALTRLSLLDALRGKSVIAESQRGDIKVLEQLLELTMVEPGSARGSTQI